MSSSEQSSGAERSTRVETKGRLVKSYPDQKPPSNARDREQPSAISKGGRRPSDAGRTTAPRRVVEAFQTHDTTGHAKARPAQLQYRRDSVTGVSSISKYAGQQPPHHNNNFKTISGSEQKRRTDQESLEPKISEVTGQFVEIKANDFQACYDFILQNKAILDVDFQDFLRDANNALRAGKEGHANLCVQRALMLRECHDSTDEHIQKFFADLIHKKPRAVDNFLKDRNKAIANLKANMKAKLDAQDPTFVERPVPQSTPVVPDLSVLSLHRDFDRQNTEMRPVVSYPGLTPTPQFEAPDRRYSGSAYNRPAASGIHRGYGPTSDGLTYDGVDGQGSNVLESDYQVRKKEAANFFTIGRVFATPWHQSLGVGATNAAKSKWVTRDSFHEPILTHIQRMAVVKEGHGFCWCVPINSYNRKGVAKSGLSDDDRDAHAVIHMDDSQPFISEAEQSMMTKGSIAVKAAAGDCKLDKMSRINFSKVHTVEHNIKVKNVGNISGRALKDFEIYWKETMEEPRRMRGR